MRNFIKLMILAILLFSSLIDCGNDKGVDSSDNNNTENQSIPIEETVLYEGNGVRVTTNEIVLMGESKYTARLVLNIENNSGESFHIKEWMVAVNGYMMREYLLNTNPATRVEANEINKEADVYLEASALHLVDIPIKKIETIDISLQVKHGDYGVTIKTDSVQIKTSRSSVFKTIHDDSGYELYNKDGIRIIVKQLNGLDYHEFIGIDGIYIYIENLSGIDINITTLIDGIESDYEARTLVMNNTRNIVSINLHEEMNKDLKALFNIYNARTEEEIHSTSKIIIDKSKVKIKLREWVGV